MSDIFISYKREEQATARKLANALESEGWSVWWDPKLRAGEHLDDVIEKVLNEAKCVIVMWSERSAQSRYVRAEATYALDRDKLVPVTIENVNLPFRFRGVHTLSLVGWDGSKDTSEFHRLINYISTILGLSPTATAEAEKRRKDREVPDPWRTYGPVAAVAVVLVIFSFLFWWPKRQEAPVKEAGVQKEAITTPQKKAEGQREIPRQTQEREPKQEKLAIPDYSEAERARQAETRRVEATKRKAQEEVTKKEVELKRQQAEAEKRKQEEVRKLEETKRPPTLTLPLERPMPVFPWPPPRASAETRIPDKWLLSKGETQLTDVADKLEYALKTAKYPRWSYSSVKEGSGFALVSHMEQIKADGTPSPDLARWSTNLPQVANLTLLEFIKALANAQPGYYRVIVFIVANKPWLRNLEKPTGVEAKKWFDDGLSWLPPSIAKLPYGPDYRTMALVYEFKKVSQNMDATFLDPSATSADDHLRKAGISYWLSQ